MAKLNWNRPKKIYGTVCKNVPKTKVHGHESHELKRIKTEHHFGKLTCITCGGKFVKWLSQDEYFLY